MNYSFYKLCEMLQDIRETRGTNAKILRCSAYLLTLNEKKNLELAAQYIGEGAFSNLSGKRATVGSRTAGLAAADFCKVDYELVFKPSRYATGSSSETIEKLMEATPAALQKREPQSITLREIEQIFERLYNVSGRDEKKEILKEAWKKMTPVEIKYFIRLMGQGSLRIGFEVRSLISAIAKAFDCETERVRYAHMLTGSSGRTAVLAKEKKLNEASFRLFHPLSFMLASPIESRSVDNLSNYVAEEKFDGMRCQLHVSGKIVKLYSRDLNDISSSFPEITDYFSESQIPAVVLDGEICVFKKNTIRPFQLLQKRMGVKKPGKKMIEEYPVIFISFDLLFVDGELFFNKTLKERREMLLKVSKVFDIPVTNQFELKNKSDLEKLFKRALARGNEGLMLKKRDSKYEYGQRKKSWLKVKKPGGSLDTVMMYAHAGSGKRGGTYSDFTLGISVKDDERYEEEFIPIGKAYGGYTDDELKKMNKKIKALTAERYGPTLGLKPGLMVEIEFDDIQINRRTKAGYTLRLPRFKRIRWDLAPSDANTLHDVEELFEKKIDKERESQKNEPSFFYIKNV